MFGRFRHFFPAAAWVLGVATVCAEAGYLPHSGPVPLRFRVLPPPVSDRVSAPVALAAPAPVSLPLPVMPAEPKAPILVPAIQTITNEPAVEYNAREPVQGPAPFMGPDALISPQMLIKYFTAPVKVATNASPGGALTPVGFTLPLVTTPQLTPQTSSKVTYSIPP